MSRYLAILEVSQKQAFIFASNKLKENIRNSAVIEYVLCPEYIEQVLSEGGYSDRQNMVYSGGGHTILEFASPEQARQSIRTLTEQIYKDYDGLEVFAKIIEYSDDKCAHDNIGNLIASLEKKKAIRKAAFHQGSYGCEYIDSDSLTRVPIRTSDKIMESIDHRIEEKERQLFPSGFDPAVKFENLGGTRNESNFIAVVHIDGNGMGNRVESFYKKIGEGASWETTKEKLRKFSEGIAQDFEAAYKGMVDRVADSIMRGTKVFDKLNHDSSNKKYFPIRRVITAGDDVCFVTEGRIGIECARIFLEELTDVSRTNAADGEGYTACAGVAIVHQKYPFYRAYELAEMLCSNAKRYGASISENDNGRSISSIDWHIEFGELKESLTDIREDYETDDGCRLEMRPYIVNAPKSIMNGTEYAAKRYTDFKRILQTVVSRENGYATGKVKSLRAMLKKGEDATMYFLQINRMTDILNEVKDGNKTINLTELFTGTKTEGDVFVEQKDGKKHSLLFDAIEILDTFIAID